MNNSVDTIKTVSTEIETYLDLATGEQLDQRTKSVKMLFNSDDFCLVYAGFWNVILNSPLSKSDIELFAYLINNYASGVPFSVTDYIKETVAKATGKNKTSYNNSVRALLEHKMIFTTAEGSRSYKINPRYAFEGSSKLRNKAVIEMVSHCKDC